MSTSDMKKARKWAKEVSEEYFTYITDDSRAAIKVIQSLPDQWVDAEKVREIYDRYRASEITLHEAFHDTVALTAPPLPTLADMDEDARHALVGKDVKVEGWNSPSMLVAVIGDEGAVLGHRWANPWPFVEVRPLSELAPADTITAESVEDAQAGRVADFEPALPRPEDVPEGEAWLVKAPGGSGEFVALKTNHAGYPWAFADDSETSHWANSAITLVSRLVPEDKP